MSKMFADVQPAVRKETKKVSIGTFVCVVLMWAVFGNRTSGSAGADSVCIIQCFSPDLLAGWWQY